MKYYLVRIDTNWADEMDISAFSVMTEKEFADWKAAWDLKDGESIEVSVGTNEELEVSYEEFEIKEISKTEYDTLINLDLGSFGHSEVINAALNGDDYYDDDSEYETNEDGIDILEEEDID